MSTPTSLRVAVCWKWVSLEGDSAANPDARWAGVSAADEAALEVALRLAESFRAAHPARLPDSGAGPDAAGSATVTVVCLGPPAADDVLRDALAVGADDVVRIDASHRLDSRVVAVAIATEITGVDLVVCGDYSMDRGTGSVPAFIAAELGVAQALGLVEVDTATPIGAAGAAGEGDVTPRAATPLRVTRRLDGGRREVLDVPVPAVVSVEGSVARLRRAPMAAALQARRAEIRATPGPHGIPPDAEVHPYRPRPRALSAPYGQTLDRVRQILDIGGDDHHAELLALEPADAAARIVEQLRDWGYLDAAARSE